MENGNGKRPVRRDPPLREWISDNLRYIILIAVIAAAVLILLFALGIFNNNQDTSASEAAPVTETVVKESTEAETTPAPTKKPTPTVTPAPAKEVTAAPKVTEEKKEEEDTLVTADKEISDLIKSYFSCLASADVEGAEAVTESISESDRSAITNGAYMRDYSDIDVWTFPGESGEEYVALVSYTYTYPGFETRIPALTALYIIEGEDGAFYIASEETEARKSQAINAALADPSVQDLRDRISKSYDKAMSDDPALAEYMASLG